MQPLQATDQSMERFSEADQFASRWEPDMLVAHTTYTDPYATWLSEHESERYSATGNTARRATGRLRRNQPPKAPWDAIPVTLSPDGR